ncbi:MAG: hypothetical protein RAO92_08680 [Candidatus Euphemobacter frigidus]|nr:hypothetical protein [Candidatus Euphemobacter frigidus]MDP8276462.1 hypothetical protein [Candidatus Euphemobacter frigidus]
MKKLIIFIIIALFVFIFIQSKTLEIREVQKDKTEHGVRISETHSREYSLHWDRFARYVKEIPRKLGLK